MEDGSIPRRCRIRRWLWRRQFGPPPACSQTASSFTARSRPPRKYHDPQGPTLPICVTGAGRVFGRRSSTQPTCSRRPHRRVGALNTPPAQVHPRGSAADAPVIPPAHGRPCRRERRYGGSTQATSQGRIPGPDSPSCQSLSTAARSTGRCTGAATSARATDGPMKPDWRPSREPTCRRRRRPATRVMSVTGRP